VKRYEGRREGYAVIVTVDGVPLNPRLDLYNHSPTGFEWGYGGSGPAQLALATPNALEHLVQDDILSGIKRHQAGDWGNVSEHDRQENEFSLKEGFRLWSVYHSASGLKFWIITEADRSYTTILLPEDY